jgi:predicted secreted hydrolase
LSACLGDATPKPRVAFPQDEGPHGDPIEWWYFNGLLTDDRSNEYSYHYVTFQSRGSERRCPIYCRPAWATTLRERTSLERNP